MITFAEIIDHIVSYEKAHSMRSHVWLLILIGGVTAAIGLAQAESEPQTQLDINVETCHEYEKADRQLNDVYQAILDAYRQDKTFLDALKKAQRRWIKFRDAEIEALYPGKEKDKTFKYGSIYPMCRCEALERLTRRRLKELKRWTEDAQESDACVGSTK